MIPYDRRFRPPAPVVDVTVSHPVTGASSGTLRAKLDTGADLTVLPEMLVARVGINPKGRVWTRAYDGSYARRPVYYVRMKIESFDIPAVRCIVADRDNVLLGRNVLNRFLITLDGKNLAFDLRQPLPP